jgi:hypothetical protein
MTRFCAAKPHINTSSEFPKVKLPVPTVSSLTHLAGGMTPLTIPEPICVSERPMLSVPVFELVAVDTTLTLVVNPELSAYSSNTSPVCPPETEKEQLMLTL